jgi:hypothetical protein
MERYLEKLPGFEGVAKVSGKKLHFETFEKMDRFGRKLNVFEFFNLNSSSSKRASFFQQF